MKNFIFMITIFFFVGSLFIKAQIKETKTDWNSIKSADGNSFLTFVKTWHGSTQYDKDSLLVPSDICMDKEGNYYILYDGVFVYNKGGKLIRKIGKQSRGNGAGEFSYTFSFDIDDKGNIAVIEYLKERLQIIYKDNSIKILTFPEVYLEDVCINRDNHLVLQGGKYKEGAPKLLIYNYDGKLLNTIGKFGVIKGTNERPDSSECIFLHSTDKEGNYYITYPYLAPVIEKYSPEGELIMNVKFELSTPPRKKPIRGVDKENIISSGPISMAVDYNGNIYVIAMKKEMLSKDLSNPETRDGLFQLVVFDKFGNLKGSKALEFYAGGIRVFGENLFIKDGKERAIHQYKIEKL